LQNVTDVREIGAAKPEWRGVTRLPGTPAGLPTPRRESTFRRLLLLRAVVLCGWRLLWALSAAPAHDARRITATMQAYDLRNLRTYSARNVYAPPYASPLRCGPPTAPLRHPPLPPDKAYPTVSLQSVLDKGRGRRHGEGRLHRGRGGHFSGRYRRPGPSRECQLSVQKGSFRP
jgi:hypothetical protein